MPLTATEGIQGKGGGRKSALNVAARPPTVAHVRPLSAIRSCSDLATLEAACQTMEGEISFTLRSAVAWPVPTAALQRRSARRSLRLRGHPRPDLQRVEIKPLQPTPRAASRLANVVAGGLPGEREGDWNVPPSVPPMPSSSRSRSTHSVCMPIGRMNDGRLRAGLLDPVVIETLLKSRGGERARRYVPSLWTADAAGGGP